MMLISRSVYSCNYYTVHTNTGKHHIPESTLNYQKALRIIYSMLCLYSQELLYYGHWLIKDTHMGSKISLLLIKRLFVKSITTDYLGHIS